MEKKYYTLTRNSEMIRIFDADPAAFCEIETASR